MGRTSAAAVQGIIEHDATIPLAPFIEAANALVTQCCGSSANYTAVDLELIERWLSAHVYTVRDMRAEREKAGDVSEKKQSKVDLGFDTSHYGQMAMRLDWEGGLAGLNGRIKAGLKSTAGMTWLGTSEDNATAPGS